MRVHVVQVAYGDDEPMSDRVARVTELVRAQRGADLVVLPELWAAGGFSYREWPGRGEPVDGPTVQAVATAAAEIGAVVHAGSIVETLPPDAPAQLRGPGRRGVWNTSVLIGPDGHTVATYRKIHRFGFGEGEPALMEAGEDVVTVPVQLPRPSGATGPFASAPAAEPTVLGLATCYDLRFPEQFRLLLDAGAELVVIPAAWPAPRVEHWRLLGRARAIENQVVVVQCNTAGTHAGTVMGGHSQVVSPTGEVLAEAGEGEEVLAVDVDLDEVTAWRQRFPVLADRRL
ncbi:MAG TPA: carbon-nitrogen family hydrolase [Kineosporiaceae bacterium]|nr:carbon-nitrogen family hydrolase [Kineosporiaceae bacterium]